MCEVMGGGGKRKKAGEEKKRGFNFKFLSKMKKPTTTKKS